MNQVVKDTPDWREPLFWIIGAIYVLEYEDQTEEYVDGVDPKVNILLLEVLLELVSKLVLLDFVLLLIVGHSPSE